jgi:hypothetical protein
MNETPAPERPTTYRILIAGHLPPTWAAWFDGLALEAGYANDQPITTLSGPISDQAHLHGTLARIRDLGLPLLLVERVAPESGDESDERRDHVASSE